MTLYGKRLFMALVVVTLVGSHLVALAGGAGVRLRARLTSAAVLVGKGQAQFESRDGRRKFSIQVEGLQPGDVFDAMVAGVVIGTIEIDGFGRGDLNFDDNAGPGDQATKFPANFPALDGGELVVVGSLSGTLQAR